jgi:hypothetical protein
MSDTVGSTRRRALLQALGTLGTLGGSGVGLSSGNSGRGGGAPERPERPKVIDRTRSSITINWAEPVDGPPRSGVSHYEVYVDGEQMERFDSPTGGRHQYGPQTPVYVSDTVTGLAPGTSYRLKLVAVDEVGNRGPPARIAVHTLPTDPGPDTVPPTVPDIQEVQSETNPLLDDPSGWLACRTAHDTRSAVDHYNVYLDGSKHTEFPPDTQPIDDQYAGRGYVSAPLDGLELDTGYELAVTAVDTAGNESSRSDARCRAQFSTSIIDRRDCSSLSVTDEGTDVDQLTVDRTNVQYFPDPKDRATETRITRDGTTESVPVVFDLDLGESKRPVVDHAQIQYHTHRTGGGITVYTRADDGGWTEERIYSEETYARTGGWASRLADLYSLDSSELRIDLHGGHHDWGVQLGRIGCRGNPDSGGHAIRKQFYVVPGGRGPETDSLVLDTSNAAYFRRPNGAIHSTRLTRTTTDDQVAFRRRTNRGVPQSATAEFHVHESSDGWLDLQTTSDYGDTWTSLDTESATYGTDAGWHHHTLSVPDFSSDVNAYRFVLTGSSPPWGVQLGSLQVEY